MKSSINLEIELDANRVPERIQWSAPDGGVEQSDTQAIMLSVWDYRAEELLRIDLWTKEMSVDHMKKMYHQTMAKKRAEGSDHNFLPWNKKHRRYG